MTGPCDCRKPGTNVRGRDPGFPARPGERRYVGDRLRDVVASKKLGGSGIMIASAMTTDEDRRKAREDGIETAPRLKAAVEMLFRLTDADRSA